jgi:two-component system, LytTR family, response regulator
MASTIRTLIVDDESRARKGLQARMLEFPSIQIIGECSSGREAVESINTQKPDLVFLDIQMPEMNGFEVLRHIDPGHLPIIVFVTAYDDYAIKAFEYHACDYLLKPVDEERLRQTIRHVSVEIKRRNIRLYAEKMKSMINEYMMLFDREKEEPVPSGEPGKEYLHRFMIKTATHITVVPADEVLWIESAGDLVYIHTREKKHIYRKTMTALEDELDPKKFIRIHRSAIVHIEKVKHLQPVSHGDFEVYLENDIRLRLSRTYRWRFQKMIEKQ